VELTVEPDEFEAEGCSKGPGVSTDDATKNAVTDDATKDAASDDHDSEHEVSRKYYMYNGIVEELLYFVWCSNSIRKHNEVSRRKVEQRKDS